MVDNVTTSQLLAVVGTTRTSSILVASTFHGSLSVSSARIAGGSYGIRVESADAQILLVNVSVRNVAQLGLDIAATRAIVVGGEVSGCQGDAGITLRAGAVGSVINGTVVRNNSRDGIEIIAANVTVSGCIVLSNREDGVHLASSATDCEVTSIVAGFNTRYGVMTEAPRTWVSHCWIGATPEGALCENGYGIAFADTATDSVVANSVVCNSTQNGILMTAPRTLVEHCWVGVTPGGARCGSGQDGVYLSPSATDCNVSSTVVGNNAGNGILTYAPRTLVEHCSVGVTLDGAPCGNGVDGIQLGEDAAGSNVTMSVIGNNTRIGILTEAPHTRVANCTIGITLNGAPFGNGDSGLQFAHSSFDSVVTASTISNNIIDGIVTVAPWTRVEHCWIGVTPDGTRSGNGRDGIFLAETATNGVITASVVGNNGVSGIYILAPRTRVENCSIGVTLIGAPCGNSQDGVYISDTATDCNVTTSVVGNSASCGINTYAPRTRVRHCSVGVTRDGTPCGNNLDGIVVALTATDSTVTSTVVGANFRIGILMISHHSRVANCSVGVTRDGNPVGNGVDGIYLDPTAAHSVIAASIIGNNGRSGIVTVAPWTLVENCSVGFTSDGAPSGNGLAGIVLNITAVNGVITATAIGNSVGTGIVTLAPNTSILGNVVGTFPNDRRVNASNLVYGIRVAVTGHQSQVRDNEVANSGWSGLRVDATDVITANNTDSHDSTSGFALRACQVCECSTDDEVQCVNVDLGPDFPHSLPPNTTRMSVSNTKLQMVGWQQLRLVNRTLQALDLSNNPGLDAVSVPAWFQGFGQLAELNLDGTNLSQAGNGAMYFVARQLRVLQLTNPSAPPDDPAVSISLANATTQLACIAWYDVAWCPAGYYSAVPAAAVAHTEAVARRNGQCTRCPVGTFQPAVGARDHSACAACGPGTVDHDTNPTTPCAASSFAMSATWIASVEAAEMTQPGANYTLNSTHAIAGVDRTYWTNNRLFVNTTANTTVFFAATVTRFEQPPGAATSTASSIKTFTDTDSGDVLVNLTRTGHWVWTLTAVDESGARAMVATHTFWVLLDDTWAPTNGPNGKGCLHGTPVDGTPFDGRFTCDCADTSFTGANCDVADTDDTKLLLAVALGAVASIGIGIWLALRMQVHRLRHRPEDVGATQEEMLQSLGLVASTDIRPSEVGITLEFAAPADALSSSFRADLVVALRRAVPKLAAPLETAKITSAAVEHGRRHTDTMPTSRVLVVMSRQRLPNDVVESAVETLLGRAARTMLRVGAANQIVDVGIAVPRRVPREIGRKCLTRIDLLGEGTFGEVHRYLVTERGMATFYVAAKSIKTGADGAADARRALICEAALGALLEHRNIVATVGVCTTPRDVPALLLLEFCPEGTLETLANAATPKSMPVAERLTYIAQTLQGLQYIASRRIVHRDVAARNVLLDATVTCKVSDLGMAIALHDVGKEYVRVNQQVALRWAAPEVVQEGKYSVQSDVWSFGVLAYEVFACGVPPYNLYTDQFDHVTAVSAFVTQGGKLGRPNPEACPLEVYTELMLPCFATDPAIRPAFGAIYEVAVKHGADEDSEAAAARAARFRQKISPAQLTADRNHLAPSVHFMELEILPAVMQAARPVVEANLAGRGDPDSRHPITDVRDCSTYQLKELIVVPRTRNFPCPTDRTAGAAYVDMLSETHPEHVGTATAILSYAWRYPIRLVVGALSEWCKTSALDPKEQYVWIDVICWNQHPGRLSDPVAEWVPRVTAIGTQLTMLHPWSRSVYMTRGWCVFELWNAIKLGRDHCDIQIILAPEDKKAFRDRINADGSDARAIDEALANVQSEEAEAFSQDDLDRIHTFILSLPGGFATLDSTIKHHLRRWFVSQGGVQVAARPVGRANSALPAQRSDPVERVRVAQFAASGSPASAISAPAGTAATGDPAVSLFVSNPAYNGQGACYEDMRDAEADIALPWPSMTEFPAPTSSAAVGRSWAGGSRRGSEMASLLGPAAGPTYEDVMPAASAGAVSCIGGSISSNARGHAADGGYMEVTGTLLAPTSRQERDVALTADLGIFSASLASKSML